MRNRISVFFTIWILVLILSACGQKAVLSNSTDPSSNKAPETETEIETEIETESETETEAVSSEPETEPVTETQPAATTAYIADSTHWMYIKDSFDEEKGAVCWVTDYKQTRESLSSYFLKPGDKVAVIAPSSLPSWGDVNAVMIGLQKWGYVPVKGGSVDKAGRSLQNCLDDMIWALTDPSIKGIFCITGGYGASELMDALPLDMIRQANKPIIGYSDISVFHAAWRVAGLPSIHATMSRSFTDLSPESAEICRQMMQGRLPVYHCERSVFNEAGSAEGILIGGNLSTLTAVLNTVYDSTVLNGPFILFLEDVDADMEQIHRYLTILKHAGVLDRAAGIIFGQWVEVAEESEITNGSSRGGAYYSVAQMIRRSFFPEADIPLVFGFPAGHGTVHQPLLMGEPVRLQVDEGGVTLEWIGE